MDKTKDVDVQKPEQLDNLEVPDSSVLESDTCVETGMDPCDHPILPLLDFPLSSSVCTTSTSSELNEFNPLKESEPNLDLDMMDQNSYRQDPIITIDNLIDDARSKRWKVSVRKLTPDEVDFLSGPKLLPGLSENVQNDQQDNPDDSNKDDDNDTDTMIVMSENETKSNMNETVEKNIASNLAKPKRKCTEKNQNINRIV